MLILVAPMQCIGGLLRKQRDKRMDSLYIVMPAYNEEENIENVVRQWYKLLGGITLIPA